MMDLLKFDLENDLIVFLYDLSGSHIIFLSDAVRLEFGFGLEGNFAVGGIEEIRWFV